ncbi:hypothetical protein [Flavobacterium sp.]|uniref:hypothetical protein n=1 Tax=Flavobacterium sp. TaxID=239 RepID=UPI0026149112|nr:hypothetical protein [Flavobacterium sp.]MDD3004095.1 hypothetical protein [Flavobacterium sp.]
MIKLIYDGKNSAIAVAVEKSNEILQNPTFYEKVSSLPQMSNTILTSREIADILRRNNQKIYIGSFWNPFSKATIIEKPCLFKVNTYKMSSITAFVVNSLINEAILAVATKCDGLYFEEKDYEEVDFSNVFPWRIGEIAEILTRKNRALTFQSNI